MAVPTWITGQVLAASDVNTWFVPLAAVKPSTQTVTSSTVLVNDTALTLPVAANRTYEIDAELLWTPVNNSTTPGLKFDFTVPAGATLIGRALFAFAPNPLVQVYGQGTPLSVGAFNAGTSNPLSLHLILIVAGTAGNLQLQWAQGVSSATSTVMQANSFLTARAIA